VTPPSDAYGVRKDVKFVAIDPVDTLEGRAASAKSEDGPHQASLTRTSAALCGKGGRRKVTPERPPHASAV
jgi:hypothetical protein